MYLVISRFVLRAGYGLYQFLIIAYLLLMKNINHKGIAS